MMSHKLKIDRQDEPGLSRLTFKGIIDEDADFETAFESLKPSIVLNFEGIELINSCGVREWVQAVKAFPKGAKIIFEKCAPRIVEQANYVANFLGGGRITSFYAPYYCTKCKKEVNILLEANASLATKAPQQKCPACKSAMDFDDIEEEYFAFLEDAS